MRYLFILIFIGTISDVFSQGNFRSIASGNWSSPATWERDADQDGIYEESPSTLSPSSASNLIDIQNSNIVTLTTNETVNGTLSILAGGTLRVQSAGGPTADRLTISVSGTLNNNGTFQILPGPIKRVRIFGTFNNDGLLTGFFASNRVFFEANSLYNHQYTTSNGTIPLASWDVTSTCQISGYTTNSTAPTNLNQSFGNFTYNCLNQQVEVDLAGGLRTVNGNLNLTSSGFIGTFLDRSNSSISISVGGDFDVDDFFYLTESGSNVSLSISGAAIFDNANAFFILNSLSGSSTLDVNGSMIMDNGAFIDMSLLGAGSSSINLAGDLTLQNFSSISAGFGSGTYTLTLDGSSAQNVKASVNEKFDGVDIVIGTNAVVVISGDNVLGTAGNFILNNSSTLQVGSTAAGGAVQTTAAGNLQVDGTRIFNSGSTIIYNGSEAQFIGSGHPSQIATVISNSNNVSLVSDVTIGGNLTLSLGAGNLNVGTNQLTLQGTVTTNGNFIDLESTSNIVIDGTPVVPFGTFPFTGDETLNNFTFDRPGETLDFDVNVSINGQLTLTNGSLLDFSGQTLTLRGTKVGDGTFVADAAATLSLNGSGALGTVRFDASGNTIGVINVNRTGSGSVISGSTLFMQSQFNLINGTFDNTGQTLNMVDGSTFTKNAGSTLAGNSPETTGSFNLVYSGGSQTTGNELPSGNTDINNFTINDGPLTLSQNIRVNGDVVLANGALAIGNNTLTVLGNWQRTSGTLSAYTGEIVFSGTTTFTGSTDFGNIEATAGANLTLPSGNFNVNGNIQFAGAATINNNGGTVVLGGTAVQNITTSGATFNNLNVNKASGNVNINSPLNLLGELTFLNTSSSTLSSGGNLTLVSTSDGTSGNARIGVIPASADITGNVTVQRFISNEGRLFRYLSSPVSGATFEEWRDDFPITGSFSNPSTGEVGGVTIIPGNPSLFRYNESLPGLADEGWEAHPPSGTLGSSIIEVGRGYAAFVRDTDATVVDVTGPVNLANITDIDLNVTYNDSGNGADNEGWNLVGNPFPSSISWDNVLGGTAGTRANVAQGIQVRDNGGGGVFLTYDGDVGGSLTDGLIATGQAFWVQTIGSSPILTLNENAKTTSTAEFFGPEGPQPEVIEIRVSDGVYTDYTFLSLDEQSSVGYDLGKDTPNLDNGIFDINTFGADSVDLAINYFNLQGCDVVIPLNLKDVETGSMIMKFAQLESLKGTYQVMLNDKFLGETHDVFKDPRYDFDVDLENLGSFGSGRFELLLSKDRIDSDLTVESANQICSNEDLYVTIPSPQIGVGYQANINGKFLGDVIVSDGLAMVIEIPNNVLIDGDNVIQLAASLAGCNSEFLSQTLAVTKAVLRNDLVIQSSGPVCNDEPGVITISNTQMGGSYQLIVNSERYGEANLANGESLIFEIPNEVLIEGANTVQFIEALEGCTEQILLNTTELIKTSIDLQILEEDGSFISNYEEGNQWYLNGELLSNKTGQSIIPEEPGEYTLEVSKNGCVSSVSKVYSIANIEIDFESVASLYPNPTEDEWIINFIGDIQISEINVFDLNGKLLYLQKINGDLNAVIPAKNLEAGVYVLKLVGNSDISNKRIIKN